MREQTADEQLQIFSSFKPNNWRRLSNTYLPAQLMPSSHAVIAWRFQASGVKLMSACPRIQVSSFS